MLIRWLAIRAAIFDPLADAVWFHIAAFCCFAEFAIILSCMRGLVGSIRRRSRPRASLRELGRKMGAKRLFWCLETGRTNRSAFLLSLLGAFLQFASSRASWSSKLSVGSVPWLSSFSVIIFRGPAGQVRPAALFGLCLSGVQLKATAFGSSRQHCPERTSHR